MGCWKSFQAKTSRKRGFIKHKDTEEKYFKAGKKVVKGRTALKDKECAVVDTYGIARAIEFTLVLNFCWLVKNSWN